MWARAPLFFGSSCFIHISSTLVSLRCSILLHCHCVICRSISQKFSKGVPLAEEAFAFSYK
uniref:Secreted protein n=1 Tax=Arundo donax TaxID=35708 RepID=A0A0A9H5D3_ARUDO